MNAPIVNSSAGRLWWSRRLAMLPLVINLLLLGVIMVSEFSAKTQKIRLARRLSVELQVVKLSVTNVRRNPRKTYVALLERWLAPPEDWPRLRSDVVAQQAVLAQSLRGFDREIDLGADERRLRAELTADIAAWCTVVERGLASSQGSESRHEVKQGLQEDRSRLQREPGGQCRQRRPG